MKNLILSACMLFAYTANSDLEYVRSIGGTISDIAVYHNTEGDGKTYLYVAQGAAIVVFDVTDKNKPMEINRLYPVTTPIRQIDICSGLLAIACECQGVQLFTLENPQNPVLAYCFKNMHGSSFQLLNRTIIPLDSYERQGGPTHQFINQKVYDISLPKDPILLTEFSTPPGMYYHPSLYYPSSRADGIHEFYGFTNGVFLNHFSRYRVVKQHITGKIILEETQIGPNEWDTSPNYYRFNFKGLFAIEQLGYFTYRTKFSSYDLSDPANPVELDSLAFEDVKAGAVRDGTSAIVIQNNLCTFIDLSNPKSLRTTNDVALSFTPKKIVNSVAYSYDESNVYWSPLFGESQGITQKLALDVYSVQKCAYNKPYLYGARTVENTSQSGVYSGTTALRIDRVTELDGLEYENEIYLNGVFADLLHDRKIIVLVTSDGFHFLDCSNPTHPIHRSTYPLHVRYSPDIQENVNYTTLLNNNHLYLFHHDYEQDRYSLRIVSLEDIDNPIEYPMIEIPCYVWQASGIENYAFFRKVFPENENTRARLVAYNLTDPIHPQFLGEFGELLLETEGNWILNVRGDRLYVCSTAFNRTTWTLFHRLRVFDISNPSEPIELTVTSLNYQDKSNFLHAPIIASWISGTQMLTLESYDLPQITEVLPYQRLYLFDISDISNPHEIGQIEFGVGASAPIIELNDLILLPANEAGHYVMRKPNENDSSVKEWTIY